jgi:erythritol transport system substrate-binding protein
MERPFRIVVGSDESSSAHKNAILADLQRDRRVASVSDVADPKHREGKACHEIGFAAGEMIASGRADRAVLVCRSGVSTAVAANKVSGVRATVAHDPYSIERSVLEANCQVLVLGEQVVGLELARRLVNEWLDHHYDPALSSTSSVDAISAYEQASIGSQAMTGPRARSSSAASSATSSRPGRNTGKMAIITVDPSNPYWATEVRTAVEAAAQLGYDATVNAHDGDPNLQDRFIDEAIRAHADAIILDPAGAAESVEPVERALDAGIPSFLVNSGIAVQGIAKAQIRANNSQGAALGAKVWAEAMNGEGTYVELFGNPTDYNARARSNAYSQVLQEYPGLRWLQMETANWNRAQGKQRMALMLRANPDVDGVIAGNDAMALGAMEVLREAGRLQGVPVLGFDGSPEAVRAVLSGEMVATVLQPIVQMSKMAVEQADRYLRTGETGAAEEEQILDTVLITPSNAHLLENFVLADEADEQG